MSFFRFCAWKPNGEIEVQDLIYAPFARRVDAGCHSSVCWAVCVHVFVSGVLSVIICSCQLQEKRRKDAGKKWMERRKCFLDFFFFCFFFGYKNLQKAVIHRDCESREEDGRKRDKYKYTQQKSHTREDE